MAGLVLIGFIAALCAPIPKTDEMMEEKNKQADGFFLSAVVAPFVEFFQRNNPQMAVAILVFILLYKFGDAFAGVMANPFYIRLGFSKVEIANVSKIFGVFATMLCIVLKMNPPPAENTSSLLLTSRRTSSGEPKGRVFWVSTPPPQNTSFFPYFDFSTSGSMQQAEHCTGFETSRPRSRGPLGA